MRCHCRLLAVLVLLTARSLLASGAGDAWQREVHLDPGGFLRQLETRLTEAESDEVRVRLLLLGAEAARDTGRYDEGLRHTEAALELSHPFKDPRLFMEARHEEAIQWFYQEDMERSIRILDVILKAAQYHQLPAVEAGILNSMGIIYWRQGALRKAVGVLEASRDLRLELGEELGLASTLNNLGIILYNLEEYPAAIANYRQVLAIAERLEVPLMIAKAQSNLGEVLTAYGDLIEAERLLLLSLEFEERQGSPDNLAFTYFNLGELAQRRYNAAGALAHYRRALEIQDSAGLRWPAAVSHVRIAQLHVAAGDFVAARPHMDAAMATAKVQYARTVLRDLHELEAKAALAAGDRAMARYHQQLQALFHEDAMASGEIPRRANPPEVDPTAREQLPPIILNPPEVATFLSMVWQEWVILICLSFAIVLLLHDNIRLRKIQ
jgi:tetratricopeptide (TPR) repeat protein